MEKRIPVPEVDTYRVGSVADYRAKLVAADAAKGQGYRQVEPYPQPQPQSPQVVTRTALGFEDPEGLTIHDVDEINSGVFQTILAKDNPVKSAARKVVSSMSELMGRRAPSMREALGLAG